LAMEMIFCQACGDSMSPAARACPKCGHPNQTLVASEPGVVSFSPPKSRIVAGILALLIGGLGVHKFYLGKIGLGVLYLVFFWTFVPAIIAFIEGIIYLVQSDEEFARNQGVNVRPS